MNYQSYTAWIPTDPVYYGSNISGSLEFAGRMARLLHQKFPGITVEFYPEVGSHENRDVTGPDETTCSDIRVFIENNWNSVLTP